MLTPRQAFKTGFLLRCAEEQLSRDATQARVKLAAAKMAEGSTFELSIPGGFGKVQPLEILKALGWTGAIGAAGIGAGGGYLAAKATEDQTDPDELKQQELISAYRQYAQQARESLARRKKLLAAPRPPRIF